MEVRDSEELGRESLEVVVVVVDLTPMLRLMVQIMELAALDLLEELLTVLHQQMGGEILVETDLMDLTLTILLEVVEEELQIQVKV